MAYKREGTERWAWLKSVGTVGDPLEDRWYNKLDYLLDSIWFPKHPRSIRAGDLLVYYAATRRVLPAVVEVVDDDVHEGGHPRDSKKWRWRMSVKPLLVVPRFRDAPRLEDVGINPLRVRRQSHILISPAEVNTIRLAFMPSIEGEVS